MQMQAPVGRHACHGIFSDRHGVMDSAWQGDAGSGSAAALLLRAGASPTGQLQLVKTAVSFAKKDGRAMDGLDLEEALTVPERCSMAIGQQVYFDQIILWVCLDGCKVCVKFL
jgi:hypothetical protein